MKFKELQILLENTNVGKIYHTSSVDFSKFWNKPTFFALDFDIAKNGWYQNLKDEGEDAYIYEAKPKGKIGSYNEKEIEELIDVYSYTENLVENPTPEEILKMSETKTLIKNGYIGIIISDYDPRDWQKDANSLLIFNPAKNTTGFKKVYHK